MVHQDGKGVWPAFMKRKLFIQYATQPPFTPLLGYWTPNQSVTAEAIAQWLHQHRPLPYLIQHQAGAESDNQAFIQANFNVKQYVQYVIPSGENGEVLFRHFNENARRNIRKADQYLTFEEATDANTLHQLVTLSYQRHQIPFTTGLAAVQRIHQALLERHQGVIWTAKDAQNRIHAAILLAWDHQTMYYLAGGLDHRFPQIGASRWLLWKAISKSREMGLAFNFGGGLTPSIDAIYQSMHGQPVPWVRMTYTSSPFLGKGILWLKKWLHPEGSL